MPVSNATVVGRDEEIEWLNSAWQNPKSKVVTVIAWGGVGKTTLINHWLSEMENAGWRGPSHGLKASQVFAHSFYSQGSSDQRHVSADHFIDAAFNFLDYDGEIPESGHEKGRLLAKLFCQTRTLLILDGLEPMQHPPQTLKGKLKDAAIEVLIKQLASNMKGLCIITSRVRVFEIEKRCEQYELQSLSVPAGIAVLNNFGVTGPKQDMQDAVTEVYGHALTLTLLGGYLSVACDGDIRKRDTIPNLVDEPNEGEHAKHVMESYQTWLEQSERVEDVNLLFIIGLFDRPVEMTTVNALLDSDVIDGVTDKLKGLSDAQLKFAIKRLVDLKLISFDNEILDCHPLVREHFANQLEEQNFDGYKQAHQHLYQYYKNLPEQELPDTQEEMQPLFNAVSHGCKAGLYHGCMYEVYGPRIRRENEQFIVHKLGAFATDLACIANFFIDDSWSKPATELTKGDQAAVFNWAALALRGLGRLQEALASFLKSLDLLVKQEIWDGAGLSASNASELYLILGQADNAVEYGQLCIEYADKSDDEFWQMASLVKHADALLQRGLADDMEKAQALFIEAEKRQYEDDPTSPYLYSLRGYCYCQLLLKQQDIDEVIKRAEITLKWVTQANWLLDIALDQLTLGKAYLLKQDLNQAQCYLDQAVNDLRKAGDMDDLPRGLLTRATYHTQTHNHQAAWQDLDESFEIASFGDMQLHLCDYHIEASRNIAVQLSQGDEPFVVIENGETIHPSRDDMVKRLDEQYAMAAKMIDELPYHFRDDDLAEVKGLIDAL